MRFPKLIFASLLIVIAAACGPMTPKPPNPTPTVDSHLVIVTSDGQTAINLVATAWTDDQGAPHVDCPPDAVNSAVCTTSGPAGNGLNAHAAADGYDPNDGRGLIGGTTTIALHKSAPPPAPFTPAQLADMQGDLMIWAPPLALACGGDGVDHRADINCAGQGGQAPGGLMQGWVWSIAVARYTNPADREIVYQAALAKGWTHYAVQVAQCQPGDDYHGLYPETPDSCASFGPRTNTVLQELHAHHLITLCAGVAPGAPPDPGVNRSLCDTGMDDWDNASEADCRIDYLHQIFPTIPIFKELPGGVGSHVFPNADSCSTVTPTATNGGAWLSSVLRRDPNFAGVLYEMGYPDGIGPNVSYLASLNAFWRDVPQYLFETDTYWKFWEGQPDVNASIAFNDQLRAGAPWLSGYMSSATSHPAPTPTPSGDGKFTGTLDASTVQIVEAPDFRGWPMTATISSVTLGTSGVSIEFSKKNDPGRWPDTPDLSPSGGMGPLQYSLGLALNINGTWYADAPVEFWYQPAPPLQNGGQIQNRVVAGCGDPGQIPCNWFYPPRWGAMQHYQPAPGETIGIFVVAGDARNNVFVVQERSEIVLLPMPQQGQAMTFTK